jgi:uncharacterized membrane protein (DUF485 family)
MIQKILSFVKTWFKWFGLAAICFITMFVLYMFAPGFLVTPFIGWISLALGIITIALIICSFIIKPSSPSLMDQAADKVKAEADSAIEAAKKAAGLS